MRVIGFIFGVSLGEVCLAALEILPWVDAAEHTLRIAIFVGLYAFVIHLQDRKRAST